MQFKVLNSEIAQRELSDLGGREHACMPYILA